jgi:hypothetical protein
MMLIYNYLQNAIRLLSAGEMMNISTLIQVKSVKYMILSYLGSVLNYSASVEFINMLRYSKSNKAGCIMPSLWFPWHWRWH